MILEKGLAYVSFASGKPVGLHPLHQKPENNGQIQMMLQKCLQRDLTQFESDMLVYPRLCMVCLDGNQVRNCIVLGERFLISC